MRRICTLVSLMMILSVAAPPAFAEDYWAGTANGPDTPAASQPHRSKAKKKKKKKSKKSAHSKKHKSKKKKHGAKSHKKKHKKKRAEPAAE